MLLKQIYAQRLGPHFERYRHALREAFPNLLDLSVSDFSAPSYFFNQSPFYFRQSVMKHATNAAIASIVNQPAPSVK